MKSLYIPSRVWLNQMDFLAEFPETRIPLFVLWCDAKLKKGPGTPLSLHKDTSWNKQGCPDQSGGYTVENAFTPQYSFQAAEGTIGCAGLGIDQYTYDSKIMAYRDIIRYALSQLHPLTIRLQPEAELHPTNSAQFPHDQNFRDFIQKQALPELNNCRGSGIYNPAMGLGGGYQAWTERGFGDIAVYLLNEWPQGCRDALFPMSCAVIYRDKIINLVIQYLFKYFEVKSDAVQANFTEVFGVADPGAMDNNSISYIIDGLPPPIDPAVADYNSTGFWSALFNDRGGTNILNSVARNLPVRIRTDVQQWQNPDEYLKGVVSKETADTITRWFTYVWQDFDIAAYPGNKVIVSYRRGKHTETVTITKDKSNAFMEILKGVGFVVGVMAAAYGISAALGAGSSAVAPATGAGLTGPTAGVAAGAETVASAYSPAVLAAVEAAGAQAGATVTAGITGVQAAAGGLTASAAWAAIKKVASSSLAQTIAKTGYGLWSAEQKKSIQEAMLKEGYTTEDFKIIPDGMTTDGDYVYQSGLGEIGGIPITWLLIGGGALALLAMLTSGGGSGKTTTRKKKNRRHR